MDFHYIYTKEQEEFRKEVKDWIDTSVPEAMRRRYREAYGEVTDEQYKFWRSMAPKLAKKGWLYPTLTKKYGGGGLTAEYDTIIHEEFTSAGVIGGSFTNSAFFGSLMAWGTEEQKQKFLTPILKGETTGSVCITEPQSGSDAANILSRAVRDGDDWLITGQKVFIGGLSGPGFLAAPIMTDPDAPRHRNLGFFMIPYPNKGLTMVRQNLLNGRSHAMFFMDNVRVPGDHLIGGDHQGWQVLGSTLEGEHGGRGAAATTDQDVDDLLQYVREAKRMGETLGSDPLVQQNAIAAYNDAHIKTLFQKRMYWMHQSHMEMSYHGSQMRLFEKDYRLTNSVRGRDIMGPYSLLRSEDPYAPMKGQPEKMQRGSLVLQHPGGAVEVQKVIIARRIGISRTQDRAAPTRSPAGASAT
ncbi:MAG: acyl-CoA dehydrogenase family protein [Chloroflexi bacterium]|nr:acyl-CoA dehydrogenase family protein [Chloroflexota bacterium]